MISGPLIEPEALHPPPNRVVFLDARAGPTAVEDYRREHLVGAIYVDLDRDLSDPGDPAKGGRHPLPSLSAWRRRLGDWGISPGTSVAIYDESSGAMAAARAWWMLHALGHTRVAVVEGGLRALVAAGFPTDARVPTPVRAESYQTDLTSWPVVEADAVARIADDPSWALLDARAPKRFAGEVEPIDPIAGHIPGARNLYWKSLVDARGQFASSTERRRAYDDVRKGAKADRVVCYCGSGVTACHLLLGMEAAGLRGVKLYVGSWSEWCRNHPL